MKKNKSVREQRISKMARLIPGGFDGTFGSEAYGYKIDEESKERHGQDIGEVSHIEGVSSNIPFSMVPYDTEGIDEDIMLYILDENFFGKNDREKLRAMKAIEYIFDTKRSRKEKPYNFEGIRNKNITNLKRNVLENIQNYERINERRPIDEMLDDSQMYYLEHLYESIKASEIPFFLYIFDKKNAGSASLNSVKHDAMHVLKDVEEIDNSMAVTMGKKETDFTASQKSHPFGLLYKKVYDASNSLATSLSNLMSKNVKTEPVGISKDQEILLKKNIDEETSQFPEVQEEYIGKRVYLFNPEDKSSCLRFFKKYMYSISQNFKDFKPFSYLTWSADSNHDIMQPLVFSNMPPGSKVVGIAILDEDLMFYSIEKLFGVIPEDKIKFLSNLNEIFKNFEEKMSSARDLFLAEKEKDDLSLADLEDYFEGKDLSTEVVGKEEQKNLKKERERRTNFKDSDRYVKELEEIERSSNPNYRSTIVSRRLMSLSGGKDSIYCFIRISTSFSNK